MPRAHLAALILFTFAGAGMGCAAQAQPAHALHLSASPSLVEVPLESEQGLPIVTVRVGSSREPLSFLVDTGFDVSLIDAATAVRLGLNAVGIHAEAQPGGEVEMGQLPPLALHLGGFEVSSVVLSTAPLEGLAGLLGRQFHGIIGHDVLARYVVDIDYPAGQLRLADPEVWRAPPGAETIPVEVRAGEPLVEARIVTSDGREVTDRFKIDTGSFDVAGLNLNFVRDHQLIGPGDRELKVSGVGAGGVTDGRLVRVRALILGSRRQERPLIGYTVNSSGFEVRDNAGTIGVQVLARSRLVLDYPHKRMFFVGPTAPAPAEDKTGLLLIATGPAFDQLEVAIVIPESPGALVGLIVGDRIVSLGGRADLTLREARALQREPGPIELVYERAGGRHTITLPRRSLL